MLSYHYLVSELQFIDGKFVYYIEYYNHKITTQDNIILVSNR